MFSTPTCELNQISHQLLTSKQTSIFTQKVKGYLEMLIEGPTSPANQPLMTGLQSVQVHDEDIKI